jgi:AraC-like DNA-binding protein
MSIFVAMLILFYNSSNLTLPANVYLSLFFLLLGIYGIIQYIIQFSSNPVLVAVVFNSFTPFFACFGPVLYLYVKKIINDDDTFLRKKELIHVLPFIITIIDLAPYLFSSFQVKVEIVKLIADSPVNYKLVKHLFLSDINATILRQSVHILYSVSGFIYVFKGVYQNVTTKTHSKLIIRWLLMLLFIMTILFISILIGTLLEKFSPITNKNGEIESYFIYVSWFFRYALIITIFFFPSILYGMPNFKIAVPIADSDNTVTDSIIAANKKEYKSFTLDDTYLEYIDKSLREYMINSPYVNDKFGLSMVTGATQIPIHHLHIYFKEYLKSNFNAWKNEHKINYSKQLIDNNMLSSMTTEAIAVNSGFKSYSNYFTVFKSHTGMTPTEYAISIKKDPKL